MPLGLTPGSISVVVRTRQFTASPVSFLYSRPGQIYVTRIDPSHASPGSFISISGANLLTASSFEEETTLSDNPRVQLQDSDGGWADAPIFSATQTHILTQVPRNAVSGSIGITNTSGQSISAPFQVDSRPIGSLLPVTVDFQKAFSSYKTPVDLAIDSISHQLLVLMAGANRVEVFPLNSNDFSTPGFTLNIGLQPAKIVLDPSRRLGFVSNKGSNAITVFRLPPNPANVAMSIIQTIPTGIAPNGLAVDKARGFLATANSGSNNVTLVHLDSLQVLTTIPTGNNPHSVAFHPLLRRLYVSHTGSNYISVIDTNNFQELAPIPIGSGQGSLLVETQSDTLMAAIEESNVVQAINLISGKTKIFSVGARPVDLAFSPQRSSFLVLNKESGNVVELDLGAEQVLSDADTGNQAIAMDLEEDHSQVWIINAKGMNLSTQSDANRPWNMAPEQEGYAGVTRLTLPLQFSFPLMLRSGSDQIMGIAFVNPVLNPLHLVFTLLDPGGNKMPDGIFFNPRTWYLAANTQMTILDSQILGRSSASDGWVHVQTDSNRLKGFSLVFDRDVLYMDGTAENNRSIQKGLFPAVEKGFGSFTEISLCNSSFLSSTVNLRLIGIDGQLVSAGTILVPANGYVHRRFEELFPAVMPTQAAYILWDSSMPLRARQSFGAENRYAVLNSLDQTRTSNTLDFAHFASGGPYSTKLTLINLASEAQQFVVTALDDTGNLFKPPAAVHPWVGELPAQVKMEIDLQKNMGIGGSTIQQGSLHISGNRGRLTGFISFGTDQALVSLVPQDNPSSTMTFAHIAETKDGKFNYFTGLALYNPNQESVGLEVVAHRADGSVVGSWSGMIPAKGHFSRLLRELPGIADSIMGQTGGYFEVYATSPVYALSLFGTGNLSALAAIPAQ